MTQTRSTKLLATLLTFVMLLGMFTGVFTLGATAATTATLTFDNATKRIVSTTTQQVWQENGITVTYNKGSYNQNLAEYAKPARFYAGTQLIIEAPGNITKIVFDCNSSSYATAMKNSIGSSATASSDKVTVNLSGNSTTYTVAKLTAQVRMDSISVTYEALCAHANQTTTNTATCTENGVETVTCDDCGKVLSTTAVEATGHNFVDNVCDVCGEAYALYKVTFSVPDGIEAPVHADSDVAIIPGAVAAPKGYDFVGWAEASVADTSVKPTILAEGDEVVLTEDTTFYAVYSLTLSTTVSKDAYIKTDIADIEATDVVVVTMAVNGTVYALPNDGGTNAAPIATKITVGDNLITSEITNALKWNISGNASGYILYPNAKTSTWLYSTTSNNGIRVGNSTNKTFVVDATTGYLKQTDTGRYLGVYNNADWRSYTTMHDNIKNQTLAFYVLGKKDVTEDVTTYTSSPVALPEFSTVSVSVAEDLKMNFYVTADESLAGDIALKVTMNGVETALNGVYADGRFCFTFAGIAPQCMVDDIVATLTLNGTEVATRTTSVLAYLETLLDTYDGNAKMTQLIYDMMAYGAAAQVYKNYKLDNLVNAGCEEFASNATPNTEKVVTESTSDIKFAGATVLFDSVNKIAIKLSATEGVVLKVDGAAMELSDDGFYYTDGISALDFDENYVFTIEVEGEVVQTLTYSVNAYATAMQNSKNENMKALATALYNFGASAEAANA